MTYEGIFTFALVIIAVKTRLKMSPASKRSEGGEHVSRLVETLT